MPALADGSPLTSRSRFTRVVTFGRLEVLSFCHSCVYTALLICAFALHNPQPETFIFGLAHGLLWIGMSLVCIAAARMRVMLGGLGPFAGTIGFVVEQRRRGQRAISRLPLRADGSQ